MAVNEKNFQWFHYVDDSGRSWSVRGEDGGAFSGSDGHAAFVATEQPFGKTSTRRHPRYIVATDPLTFRTVKGIIYTAAAYAAIAPGAVVNVSVAGGATAVPYNVSAKIQEKMPIPKAARQLAE